MRIDKYLKVSRIIKRRTLASDICSAGRVKINDKVAKPSSDVKIGDKIDIEFGTGVTSLRILDVRDNVRKEEATSIYEIL